MLHTSLIAEIETYCAQTGLQPSTFGVKAVGNSRLLDRLRRKSDDMEKLAERVRAFIADHPPMNANEATQ